jgi:hypothetical protein
MAVFSSREAAEEFVRDDRFVNEGVIKAWTLRDLDSCWSGRSGQATVAEVPSGTVLRGWLYPDS